MNSTEFYYDIIRKVRAKPGCENIPIPIINIMIAVVTMQYLCYLDEIYHTNFYEESLAAVTEKVKEKFLRKNEVIQNEEVF